MASSSSTSSSPQLRYQVFLSFRGADTRHNFTSHLLETLEKEGVNVFFDEKKLKKGEDVAPALSSAITVTKISVIILSEDYASSNSCLDELSDIMELKETKGHIVRPIFYHVDPSNVEKVNGSFETSFKKHKNDKRRTAEQVKRWETAFREVGKLGGCVIKKDENNRHETDYIRDIVDSVTLALMKHQIFLSFGEMMRPNFADHLHKALECRGLNVFISNGTLEEKSQAIADSDISIIIFSDDYVSSESCLAEVSEIMKHRETRKQTVFPIFYQVETSDVRRKIPVFGKAGNIKGWTIKGENHERSEADCIKVVAKDVILKLQSKCKNVSEGKFGLYDQKKEILRLVEKEGTRVIGLWGPVGIGKTTLAEAIFNEISPYFEAHSFVQNVREKIVRQGFQSLRDKLLSKLLNSEIHVETPSISCNVTKDRMKNIKVLVVLDDVSEVDHIADMGIEHFGDGSKIIVTCTDSRVIVKADEKHKVEELCENDSFKLFSSFAFNRSKHVTNEFRKISSKFLTYAQRNPLALKVLGSHLYDKPINEWPSVAANLGEYGKIGILKVCKISYDGLGELEQKIFLDIAIFFKGNYHKEDVEAYLRSCYDEGYLDGISRLVEKCLLDIRTIHPYKGEPYLSFYMHDMFEELGKKIQSEDNSRNLIRMLWRPKDVIQLLNSNQRADSIEGIKCRIFEHHGSRPTAFPKMPNLRFIEVFANTNVMADAVDIEVLSDELRYLDWLRCPFKSLPSTFSPVNLITLKLSWGKIKQLWIPNQVPLNLRELDVSFCKELQEIPNLSGATNLKILDCRCCDRLVKLAGLRNLKSLEKLNFYRCTKLKRIPSLSGATELKTLNCYGCTELVELADLENLASLEELKFDSCQNLVSIPNLSGATKLKTLDCRDCTRLVKLPPLNHLRSLVNLSLCGCESLKKFPDLPNNFFELDLSFTGIEEVSASIEHLTGIKSLNMIRSEVKKVSSNISKLESLQVLIMRSCPKLEILPSLPPNLVQLDAHNCRSLKEVSFTVEAPNLHLDQLPAEIFCNFSECSSLNSKSVDNIVVYVIDKIKYLAMGRLSGPYPPSKELFCCLPEKEISANKFKFQMESLTFEIDKTVCSPSGNLAFAICLVVDLTCLSFSQELRVVCEYQLTALTAAGCDEKGRHTHCLDKMNGLGRNYTGDHMLILFSDKLIFKGEYKKASFTFHFDTPGFNLDVDSSRTMVKKCGVHFFPVDL